ncbi:MAG: GTP pyrophosphokinase family protein [Candidatus Gastranaerophilales bacterium]|nr:GTP pyrophosphokinase family protein [Candidatus Gastranaerophilales bacterium]
MTSEQYHELITPYEDACKVLLTKLEILNHSIYSKETGNPVHHIQHRIKTKMSMEEKLGRQQLDKSVIDAKDHLMDIAGIRVICYFPEEIYDLVNGLKCQNDMIVIKEKDYIRYPKPNGYRSFHIVFGVPLHCMDAMEYYPVEIQFRTLSMDFWASMEHRVSYKKDRDDREKVIRELQEYALMLEHIEERFGQLRP